ncbi:hypothetical protein WA026_013839 [Henosepilachna vigintioctopunctata]|uniref:Rho guanine nucleotide exchange factor n=1 Tax=Henosepilachna vigintioctopunctata TaxID=420089 RepID=A0AAW1UZN4_9CUCU
MEHTSSDKTNHKSSITEDSLKPIVMLEHIDTQRTPNYSKHSVYSNSKINSNLSDLKYCETVQYISPLRTPKANIEFSRELKETLHERNLLTTRTKKKVFDVLNEIEENHELEGSQRKRENAIFEIIVSEKSYVNQLSVIINFFMKPIKQRKLLNNNDYETLFGNIQTIYTVNNTLLKELYRGSTNVANAFLKIAPYFKLYSSYAIGFKNTLSTLQKLRIQNPEFYNFMENQETRPEVQNKLSALLIAPIQRIPRYRLLLQQLHELSAPKDPNYNNISESLVKVEEAAEHINKLIEEQENIQRLLEVQRCLKNNEPSIITPGRVLLKEGILLQFDKTTAPSQKFYVILLNDIILFSKMKSSSLKPNSLKCKKIFPLTKCTILENVEKGCFQIHCQGDDVVLYDRIVSITKEWIDIIQKAIESSVLKRKTLRKESSARRPVKRKDLNEYNDLGLSPGIPLKRKRQTIEEEIKNHRYSISPRRSIRSETSYIPKKSDNDTFYTNSASHNIADIPEECTTENEVAHRDTPTDVFVFGRDNPNTGFTFRLTNMINNIGSSVLNMFKFRR